VVTPDKETVIGCAGSRYTYSPNSLAIGEALKLGLQRVALVGVPCHIQALRRLQRAGMKQGRRIAFSIGLLCTETFSYEGLMLQKLEGELGINLAEVVKVDIKGQFKVYLKSGQILGIPLKDLRKYSRPGCGFCTDFAAQGADLSLGGVGLQGWTLTIVRTEKGRDWLRKGLAGGAIEVRPAEEFPSSVETAFKLSRRKAEIAGRKFDEQRGRYQ